MSANLHLDFHDSNHDIIIQLICMLHNVANALNGGWLIHKKSLKKSEVN